MRLSDIKVLISGYENFDSIEKKQAVIKFLNNAYFTAEELRNILQELNVPNRTKLLKILPTPHRYFRHGPRREASEKAVEKVAEYIDLDFLVHRYIKYNSGGTLFRLKEAFPSDLFPSNKSLEINITAVYEEN